MTLVPIGQDYEQIVRAARPERIVHACSVTEKPDAASFAQAQAPIAQPVQAPPVAGGPWRSRG